MALLVVFGFLAVLSITDKGSPSNTQYASALGSDEAEAANPMDKLSSADIAVHVARVAQLEEANSVTNYADTAKAQVTLAAADDKIIAKPQVMTADGLKSKKDILLYTVEEGDTVPKIANKFEITSETVRLSNNLDGDTVDPGSKLWISPINGIIYQVKDGDTPSSIAAKYRANKDEVIAFNDGELGGFKPGERIVIPDGLSPISSEYNYYSAGNPAGFAFGDSPDYGGVNGYDYGWCTWHAANRRMEIGRPIPNNMGNAISWLGVARAMGLETGSEPREGAVVYHLDIGGWGHVAFVEKVNPDGSIKVSDMNYPIWGQVTYRKVEPSQFGSLRFIY